MINGRMFLRAWPIAVSRHVSRLITVAWRIVTLASATLLCLGASAGAQDPHLGLVEYEIACMPCHGIKGRGDGPLAGKLPNKPSDLTLIAKANGGTFPPNKVMRIIDGRKLSSAHRRRTMPIWGERYRRRTDTQETTATIEQRARKRIEALVRYVETLQQR
jgi:mono/diheme cytochrome c family protein